MKTFTSPESIFTGSETVSMRLGSLVRSRTCLRNFEELGHGVELVARHFVRGVGEEIFHEGDFDGITGVGRN